MEEKQSFLPNIFGSNFVLRSTEEEVEVIAFNLVENGDRNEGDWVTYIDSEGKEHIKEHLNISLDFKPTMSEFFQSMFKDPKYESLKFPSTENTRVYELVKEMVIHQNCSIEEAITKAKEIVNAVNSAVE